VTQSLPLCAWCCGRARWTEAVRWRSLPEPEIGGVVLPGKSLGLSPEMVGDAEHEEVGAIVGGDVAAVEGKLGEVVFVLDEGGD